MGEVSTDPLITTHHPKLLTGGSGDPTPLRENIFPGGNTGAAVARWGDKGSGPTTCRPPLADPWHHPQGTIPRGTQGVCAGGVIALPPRPTTMGSVGAERFKELSPAGTPEGNVVMSFSFDSYQLEEDELQRGSQAKGVLTFMEPGEGRRHPNHSQDLGSCCFPTHLGASWDGFNSHKWPEMPLKCLMPFLGSCSYSREVHSIPWHQALQLGK